MSGTTAPEQAPATLRWAVRLLFVEGAGLALLTLLFVYFDVTAEWTAAEVALSSTGYLALMTALFLGVAVALHRRRRWARGPALSPRCCRCRSAGRCSPTASP